MPGPLALLVEQVQFEHFLLISTLTILSLVAYSAYGLYTSWKARQPYPGESSFLLTRQQHLTSDRPAYTDPRWSQSRGKLAEGLTGPHKERLGA